MLIVWSLTIKCGEFEGTEDYMTSIAALKNAMKIIQQKENKCEVFFTPYERAVHTEMKPDIVAKVLENNGKATFNLPEKFEITDFRGHTSTISKFTIFYTNKGRQRYYSIVPQTIKIVNDKQVKIIDSVYKFIFYSARKVWRRNLKKGTVPSSYYAAYGGVKQ